MFCNEHFEKCHFMSERSAPPPQEQAKIIRELVEATRLEVGVDAYIISSQWWNQWKAEVDFDRKSSISPLKCGPIDNKRLVKDNKLDPMKRELRDFEIITKQVWDKLHEWFGGGPVVTVPVANNMGKPTAVLRMLNLNFHYRDARKAVEASKYDTVEQLRERACAAFGVEDPSQTRVVDYWKLKVGNELELNKQLSQCTVYDGQDMLLDYKENGGSWHTEKVKSARNPDFSMMRTHMNIRIEPPVHAHLGPSQPIQIEPRTNAYAASYSRAGKPGVVGLSNLGNTCYFNSGVQCLMHTVPLMQKFLRTEWQRDLNVANPLGARGELAKAFGALAVDIWSGRESFLRPVDLKRAIAAFASQFSGYEQQDAHELVLFLLDGIHEDLNRRKTKLVAEPVNGNGENDLETAEAAWRRHLGRNDSIIVDLFQGQLRSKIFCPECRNVCVVFDPFTSLSLPLVRQDLVMRKVTFVPADFSQPHQELVISISSKATADQCNKAISRELGRDVTVLFGYATSSSIDWGPPSISRSDSALAFEITDPNAFYVPVVIKMRVKTYTWAASKVVAGPFLLRVSDSSASESDVADAAEEQLQCLWKKPDFELNAEAAELLEKIELPDEPFEDGRKFMAIFPAETLTPDFREKRATKSYVILELNGKFVTPPFSLESLLRHYRGPSSTPSSALCYDTLTLDQCFQLFVAEETLTETNQWFCPKCRKHVCADTKTDIWKAPKCLIIHLNRFKKGSSLYMSQKIQTNVSFPEVLDMRPYIVGPQKDNTSLQYKLYAVSEHTGTCNFGHYTAQAMVTPEGQQTGTWYSFNDASAAESSPSSAHTSAAYILFYERIE